MSTLVASINLKYASGNAILDEWTVTKDGSPLNLTGMDVRFAAAPRLGEDPVLDTEAVPATAAIVLNDQGVDPGKFRLSIDGADTESLEGHYRFEIEVEDTDGKVATVARGFMYFHPNLI